MSKKTCGIYIIKNKINSKIYIGQSVNIENRWKAHIASALHPNKQDHYTKIHQAMCKYGIDNFSYEIIEECEEKELNSKEIYWINYFDSYCNGYNMTLGGESNKGETNGRALMTLEQVKDIRQMYNEHIPFKKVLEKYKEHISKRGLQKIWHHETWLDVMPEVYSEENKKWHATFAKAQINGTKQYGKNNVERACNLKEIEEMKRLRAEGLSYKEIGLRVNRSATVVRKYCLNNQSSSPQSSGKPIKVLNIETNIEFNSLTQASKWAKCSKDTISAHLGTDHPAGKVPNTNEPAHWKLVD